MLHMHVLHLHVLHLHVLYMPQDTSSASLAALLDLLALVYVIS